MGWLLACLFAVLFWHARRKRQRPQQQVPQAPSAAPLPSAARSSQRLALAHQHLYHLIVLALELERLRGTGVLPLPRYVHLTSKLNAAWSNIVRDLGATPDNTAWQQARDAAWQLLVAHQEVLEPPPWLQEVEPPAPTARAEILPPPVPRQESLQHRVEIPPPPVIPPPPAPPPPVRPSTAPPAPRPREATPPPVPLKSPSTREENAPSYAWEPAPPSALERAMQAVSGWPAVVTPFLVQNFGWFIGGFCFIAGSIFLVAYTSGFAKTLASFAVLSVYTLLLLWGGYQIRRRQPALTMSSNALLILGMLLVPLNVTAAVRLLLAAQQAPALILLGLLAAGAGVGGLYVTATLVSGIMDRTLQRHHPRLFLALAAVQLAAPLLALQPAWPLLVLCHGIILALLAYGFVTFLADWLQAIFLERRKLAYYAAGTLVYAATVSFVHLTWGYAAAPTLPPGYYGPWLMLLCGLLFYVDTHLKRWTAQAAFLSYSSFVVYGLSIIALVLALEAPLARLITLILALGLYGMVTWQYATFPPLYLLLGCAGWLYHDVVLRTLPFAWHCLASLPWFVGLGAASRWAYQRGAGRTLALVGYRVLVVLLVSLAAWSLGHAQPGWGALATSLLVMGFAFVAPRLLPLEVLGQERWGPPRLARQSWLYLGTSAALVVVAYAPSVTALGWVLQGVYGTLLVATVWITVGLWLRHIVREDTAASSEALLNSAVLYIGVVLGLSVLLGLHDSTLQRLLPFVLGLAGALTLWLSLALGVQWLLYGVLGLWGAAGALLKLLYFPAPGNGLLTLLLALVLWGILLWVERLPVALMALRQEHVALRAARSASLTLLWCVPVAFHPVQTVLWVPLRQAMVVLWGFGVAELSLRLLHGMTGGLWGVSATLAALVAGLLTGALAWPWLWPVALLLGLLAWLNVAWECGVSTLVGLHGATALYALLVWRLGVVLLAHPTVQRLARLGSLRASAVRLEALTHWTAFAIVMASLGLALLRYEVFFPSPLFLLPLATSCLFLVLAGQRYQYRVHRYLVVEIATWAAILGYVWWWHHAAAPLGIRWLWLLESPGLGLTSVLLSLGLWGMVRWIATVSDEPEETTARLAAYHLPLQHVAIQWALLAALQSLGLLLPASLGWPYTGGFLALAVLGLAGFSVLQAPHVGWHLGGLLSAVLAVVGMHSLWWYGTPVAALWLGQPGYVASWWLLAILALGLASLAQVATQVQSGLQGYRQALYVAAFLPYSWALLAAMALVGLLPGRAAAAGSGVFGLLTLALVPLAQPLPGAAALRGLGCALLLSASVLSGLGSGGWQGAERLWLMLWAYGLWGLGNFVVPHANARWPHWAIAPTTWPWLGLLLLGSAVLAWGLPGFPATQATMLRLAGYLTPVALYLFLVLRNSAWPLWPWLAVGVLSSALLTANAAWFWPLPISWGALGGVAGCANVLLLGVTGWRRAGAGLRERLGWRLHDLSLPLLAWASALLVACLLYLAVWDVAAVGMPGWATTSLWQRLPAVFLGLFLGLSFAHVARLHGAVWPWHGAMAALFCALLALWHVTVASVCHPPLFLALWSVLLIGAAAGGVQPAWSPHLRPVVRAWYTWSPLATVVVWALFVFMPLAEHLGMLALGGAYAASLGWQRRHARWLLAALLIGVVQLHGWWLVWLTPQRFAGLLPWYTLQLAGLMWGAWYGQQRLATATTQTDPRHALGQALAALEPLVLAGALLTWTLHLLYVVATLWLGRAPQWLLGPWEGSVATLALVLLMAAGIRQAWRHAHAGWTYGTAILGVTLWAYLRLLWVGLAPFQIHDTLVLIGASYGLFFLQQWLRSEALRHVALLLPLLAVATAPWQLASLHTSGALLSASLLYLSMRQFTGRSVPLYMGLLTLNAGLYLWIPGLAHTQRVLQFYTIPAALSVLWLLQAHRRELRPAVLHGCRLAASSVLYLSATLDVFLRSDLTVFLVALGLSLGGMILGLMLRTRAFLYAGASFFVLNVAGQLLLLFPEQRLARAIVLLTLGTLITGSMIWFNIQREAILQRIRIFRADIATWV